MIELSTCREWTGFWWQVIHKTGTMVVNSVRFVGLMLQGQVTFVTVRMLNFLAIESLVHPAYMVHPITVEVSGEPDISNQPCGKQGACSWEILGMGWLVRTCSKCSSLKGRRQYSFYVSLILLMLVSELHIE